MVLALLLFAAATTCPGSKTEIHGTSPKAGRLEVYSAPGEVEASADMKAGKPWSVCVESTDHGPIKTSGPYVPWFDEVHYAYKDGTARHERWAVPRSPKSVDVKTVVTDGVLK